MTNHLWISGGSRRTRDAVRAGLGLPATIMTVDAHRNRRGPYTAAGTWLRQLVPTAVTEHPDLVRRHEIEILAAAPELRAMVPATRETLASLAIPTERTRFHTRLRTGRMAHGLAEFLGELARRSATPGALVIENVHAADPTDLELIEILLRWIDPAQLLIVAGSAEESPHTTHSAEPDPENPDISAREYVWADGTLARPAAYDQLAESERQKLHDQRAAELEARGDLSLQLGAIPYHRERGSDLEKARQALEHATETTHGQGYYHATIELAERGRILTGWDQPRRRFRLTADLAQSLAILDRAAEAEQYYGEIRLAVLDPELHMAAAYGTAMLYTRHHTSSRKDNDRARAWINQAVAIASLLPAGADQNFQEVFMRNGLALIEVHAGRLDEALRLVNAAIATLDAELGPDQQRLHRSVLRFNRGQVYAGLGRTEEAVADYTEVIGADPNFAEYYFDRAGLLRRLGRVAEALADYTTATRVSPPFAEAFYNRADLLLELGEPEAARADLDRVLAIDPDCTDAYVNRAGIRLAAGDLEGALKDAFAGLAREAENPHLLAILGQVHAELGRAPQARAALDQALAHPDAPAEAWAARAAVRFDAGDLAGALADLEQAVALTPADPATLFNRALILQELGRPGRALADLREAQALAPDDEDIALALADPRLVGAAT
jgi:tetratricopeptide (TPR) repeat protein